MATIREIAKACGVSVATVSNILNDKPGASEATKQLVKKMVEEMEYTPNYVAKNLKTRNSRCIGVIAEDITIFSIPDIIDGITEYCEKEKYQILLTNLRLYKKYSDIYYHGTEFYSFVKQEIKKLLSAQVDGIIYVTAHERILQCIPENLTIPAVMAYGYTESTKIPSVVVDDETGGYEQTQYLIQNGHKCIGVIAGKPDSLHTQARLLGYQKALRDSGILYDPEIVHFGDWSRDSGYECAKKLKEQDVTAVFCMNDLMAGGCYDYANEIQVAIPEQISIVGYDNRELSSYYQPPLSTTELPLHDIGYRAAQVMIDMVEHKTEETGQPIVHKMPCKQLIRQSVRKIM